MDIDEIILRELEGELSEEDRLILSAWLKEKPRNEKVYNQVKLIMASRGSKTKNASQEVVLDQLRERINSYESQRNPQSMSTNKKEFSIGSWIKYAAIIFLSIGLGALIHQIQTDDQTVADVKPLLIEKVSNPGQKITTKLPDGTVVKLNANSRIIVPEQFQGNTRRVELHGEAFFDVYQDKTKPFIINVGNMEVKVLGTSFSVKEDDFLGQKIVAVKTGKVTVEDKNSGELVVLDPSQMVIQNNGEGLYKKDFVLDDEIFGWTENKLVFNDDGYQKVLRELGYWFGKEVVINGNIDGNLKYTATYVDPTLEEVLLSSSHIFEFEYKMDGDKIIIE
ncbi:MAG: FecR family protein [Bacteroidota bacterium]